MSETVVEQERDIRTKTAKQQLTYCRLTVGPIRQQGCGPPRGERFPVLAVRTLRP